MVDDSDSVLGPSWALDFSDEETAELDLCQCGGDSHAAQFFSETNIDGNDNTVNNVLVFGATCPECGKPRVPQSLTG